MSSLAPSAPADHRPVEDRILLVGGARPTLDLLRLATIRSDDVVLVGESVDDTAAAYALRFAVERQAHAARDADLTGAASILVALDDLEHENKIVRAARRRGIPVFVSGRPLVSDFTLLEFLERRPSATAS